MATFQDRANNGCTAKIRLKGHVDSMTFYPSAGKTARQLAEKWARDEEEKILEGNFVSAKKARKTTLTQALDDYENNFAKKLKGYDIERYRIEAWRTWKYKDSKLSELLEKMFNEYRDERRKYVKDGSIRLDLAVITAIFSNTRYGIENPAAATISTLAAAAKRDRRLLKTEQKYLLDALFDTQCSDPKRANEYLPLVAIFAIETACRLSEIAPRTSRNKETGQITVHTTGLLRENVYIDDDKSVARIFDTKNGTDRWVPLTPAAVEAHKRALEIDPSLRGPVFRTTVSAIKQAWQRAKVRAKKQYIEDGGTDENFLVNFHFHDLRHEAASRWKKYFDLHKLKDITGHKDIRSLSRYLHSDEDDVKAMAKEMSEIQNQNVAAGDKKMIEFPAKKQKRA